MRSADRTRRRHRAIWSTTALLAPSIAALTPCSAQQAQELPPVEVVAPTPVPGLGVPLDQIPANVQIIGPAELREDPHTSVVERLGDRLPSVNVNQVQGNPFQPDLNFRGFTASPLLGTPQGISVYQDGVRINEPFGDIVNWDLIPQAAIESITLMPGSNPLYGLNTLGGAIALRTKSGLTSRGGGVELYGGAFRRRSGEFDFGRRLDPGQGVFLAGTWFKEAGWRDFSPSEVKQLFGKWSLNRGPLGFDLSLTHGNTDLIGNGLVPASMLAGRRETIFTRPDNTRNRLTMVTLEGRYELAAESMLSALLYDRRMRARTLNGDANDDFEDGANDLAAGGTGLNIGTAANNRTATRQDALGGALQWSALRGGHELAIGISHDRSRARFEQTSQLGIFDMTRAVVETDPLSLQNALTGRTSTSSFFFTDTWNVARNTHLTLAGRYNSTRVVLHDVGPSAPALDGAHRFSRFNPATGITHRFSPALAVYAGFAQGNRAPSPIELGCADPQRPCTLPNALAGDPPLKQVVARTVEAGARGRLANGVRWNAGVYQANNRDDILFVGTTTSAGYFTNFGHTQRRGVELGAAARTGAFDWRIDYSMVRATFQSGACIVAENNSSRGTATDCSPADPANPGTFRGDDLIAIRRGDRMPGIPTHSIKAGLRWRITGQWRLGADVLGFSSQFVRGNENNQHQAGTATDLNGESRTFLGAGKTGGYMLVNLNASYRPTRNLELFARVNNAFDRKHAAGGVLAENPFNAAGTFQTNSENWTRETFLSPGAPRAIWIGVRARFAE